jgi:hypothetical protein
LGTATNPTDQPGGRGDGAAGGIPMTELVLTLIASSMIAYAVATLIVELGDVAGLVWSQAAEERRHRGERW